MSGMGWSFFFRAYLVCIFDTSVAIDREVLLQPIDLYKLYLRTRPQYLG